MDLVRQLEVFREEVSNAPLEGHIFGQDYALVLQRLPGKGKSGSSGASLQGDWTAVGAHGEHPCGHSDTTHERVGGSNQQLCRVRSHQPAHSGRPGIRWANQDPRSFTYDYCFSSLEPSNDTGTQEKVYTDLGADMVNNVLEGYNCCLFAYGQTGSENPKPFEVSQIQTQYEAKYAELRTSLEADCRRIVDDTVRYAQNGMERYKSEEHHAMEEMKEEYESHAKDSADINEQLQQQVDDLLEEINKLRAPVLNLDEPEKRDKGPRIEEDLRRFLNRWDATIAGMESPPDDLVLRDILLRQIRKCHLMKYDIEAFDRASEKSDQKSYAFLLQNIRDLLDRERLRANRNRIVEKNKQGAEKPQPAAAAQGDKPNPRRKNSRGRSRER
eukprot:s2998_g1.t1